MSEDSRPRAYLLGQLTPQEREEFEEELFADTERLEALQHAETDLFDDAAAGRLSPSDLEAWNRYVRLQPRLRQRTTFAHAWKNRKAPRSFPWLLILPEEMVVAPIIAFLAAFLFLIDDKPVRPKPAPITFAFQLQSGTLRSNDAAQILRIPSNANFIRLNLAAPDPATLREATTLRLRHVDSDRQTWQGPSNASVPREVFLAGDMIATLLNSRGEELADYTFRVELLQ
ncbi:hypothetical protein WDZ92_06470 [Nostoc sp. NIES-2111]